MNNSSFNNRSVEDEDLFIFALPYEHRLALWVINSLGSLLGVFGNSFVLIVLISSKKLHSKTNMLLMSLIVSGLLIALILQPIRADQINPHFHVELPYDAASGVSIISYLSCIFSILSVTAERFIAVWRPFRYVYIVTSFRIKVVLALIWAPSILTGVTLYHQQYRQIFDKVALVAFSVVIFASILMYSYIFYIVHKQKRFMTRQSTKSYNGFRSKTQKADSNSTTVAATFVTIFAILWLPTLIYLYLLETFLHDYRLDPRVAITGEYLISLHLWNGSINWYVYCWKCKAFRSVLNRRKRGDRNSSADETELKNIMP